MSMVRNFESIAHMAHFMEENAAISVDMGPVLITAATRTLGRKIRKEYGDRVLTELADATKEDRASKGYSDDQPLLRTGQLLRDQVEEEVGVDFAAVGTSEMVNVYHEYGSFNAKTGKMNPPRPAFRIGTEEAAAPIVKMLESAVGAAVGLGMFAGGANGLFSDYTTELDSVQAPDKLI
ncbi:MAG: hypothetical protein KGL39_21995 [Patescibacteria group bacterium]|nr:hypothetical protein [Patescibacteria group bacterium]